MREVKSKIMNTSFKFKFLHFGCEYSLQDLMEDFDIVPNPTPFDMLPDGEYLIRGNRREHRKEYWKLRDIWFLVDEKTQDNGHYMVDATKFELFPNLSEKEWGVLNNPLFKGKLTKYWTRALRGRNFWMELREQTRMMHKGMLEYYR